MRKQDERHGTKNRGDRLLRKKKREDESIGFLFGFVRTAKWDEQTEQKKAVVREIATWAVSEQREID
jgi:hypothetical protein